MKKASRAARVAKVFGLALAVITIVCTVAAFALTGSAAQTAPSGLPTTIPDGKGGETEFTMNIVEDFSGKGAVKDETRGSMSITGGQLVLTGTSNSAECRIEYTHTKGINAEDSVMKIEKGTDGLIYYVDASASGLGGVDGYNGKLCFELCFGSWEDPDFASQYVTYGNDGVAIKGRVSSRGVATAYSYAIGGSGWTETANINGGRIAVDANFKGFIYIPFDSYIVMEGQDNGVRVSDIVENYNMYVPSFWVYTGNLQNNKAVYFDNIATVKFDTSLNVESEAPTVLPDGREVADKGALLDFDEDVFTKDATFNKADGFDLSNKDASDRSSFKMINDGTTGNVISFYDIVKAGPEQNFFRGQDNYVKVPEGTAGIMYYVNTTDLKGSLGRYYDEGAGMYDGDSEQSYLAVGLRIQAKADDGTTNKSYNSSGLAYYYTDGSWYRTTQVDGASSTGNNNRIIIPEGFEGYIYVPLENYGLKVGTTVRGVFVLSDYVDYGEIANAPVGSRSELIIGDIQFVGRNGTAAVNKSEPMPNYVAGGATGNQIFSTTTLIDFEGVAPYKTAGLEALTSGSSIKGKWSEFKGTDFTFKIDAANNDTELVMDLSANRGQGRTYLRNPVAIDKEAFAASSGMTASKGGIMFHLDVSGMKGTGSVTYEYDGKSYTLSDAVAFAPVFFFTAKKADGTSYTIEAQLGWTGANKVPTFYSYDDSNEWSVTTNVDAGRHAYPSDFSGWVYVPWSSITLRYGDLYLESASDTTGFYAQHTPIYDILNDTTDKAATNDGTNITSYGSVNFAGGSVTLTGVRFYSGLNDHKINEAAQFVIDDFVQVSVTGDRAIPSTTLAGSTTKAVAEAIAAGMTMENGANIRLGSVPGIRFKTNLDKSGDALAAYNAAFPNGIAGGGVIEIGTLIAPTNKTTSSGLTITNASAINAIARVTVTDNDTDMQYTAVVTDLPYSYYGVSLTARSYISYVDSGAAKWDLDGTISRTYIYIGTDGADSTGAAATPVSRSYSQVAGLAQTAATGETKTALENILMVPTALPGSASSFKGVRTMTTFDSNFKSFSLNGDKKGNMAIVDYKNGTQALKIYDGNYIKDGKPTANNQLETGSIRLQNTVDAYGYTGIMLYIDYSTTTGYGTDGCYTTGFNFATTTTSGAVSAGAGGDQFRANNVTSTGDANTAYYYAQKADGTYEWKAISGNSGYRINLPKNFAGYVYIPLSAYTANFGGVASSFDDASIGVGENVTGNYRYIVGFSVYSNNTDQKGEIFFDNFCLVK